MVAVNPNLVKLLVVVSYLLALLCLSRNQSMGNLKHVMALVVVVLLLLALNMPNSNAHVTLSLAFLVMLGVCCCDRGDKKRVLA